MQTSVSQRPLTARKRQLQQPHRQVNGLHQRSGSLPDSQENLLQPNSMAAAGVSSGSGGRMQASPIPAFRSANNRGQLTQLTRRNSQERDHRREAGASHADQSVDPSISHESLLTQPQSWRRGSFLPGSETNTATPQQGDIPFTQHTTAVQPTRSSARDGPSSDKQSRGYQREESSLVARELRGNQHHAHDENQDACKSLQSQHGSKPAPWLPDQQFAAAGQMHRSSECDTVGAAQAAAAAGTKPVMYVRPPWAIDDPYQVQCHSPSLRF